MGVFDARCGAAVQYLSAMASSSSSSSACVCTPDAPGSGCSTRSSWGRASRALVFCCMCMFWVPDPDHDAPTAAARCPPSSLGGGHYALPAMARLLLTCIKCNVWRYGSGRPHDCTSYFTPDCSCKYIVVLKTCMVVLQYVWLYFTAGATRCDALTHSVPDHRS